MEGTKDHPLQVSSGRADLEIIMAIFESSLRRRAIDLPFSRGDLPSAGDGGAGRGETERCSSMGKLRW